MKRHPDYIMIMKGKGIAKKDDCPFSNRVTDGCCLNDRVHCVYALTNINVPKNCPLRKGVVAICLKEGKPKLLPNG